MNKFIFDGFYGNILSSFGWQNINIAAPLDIDLSLYFLTAQYVVEIENGIKSANKIQRPAPSCEEKNIIGKLLVYIPDIWKYIEYYFYDTLPKNVDNKDNVYEINSSYLTLSI